MYPGMYREAWYPGGYTGLPPPVGIPVSSSFLLLSLPGPPPKPPRTSPKPLRTLKTVPQDPQDGASGRKCHIPVLTLLTVLTLFALSASPAVPKSLLSRNWQKVLKLSLMLGEV